MLKSTFKILIILTLFSNCNRESSNNTKDQFDLKYVNIWNGMQPIDTTYRQLKSINFEDSIYLLNYIEIDFDGDTVQRNYELPISNSEKTFNSLKDTSELRLKYEGLRYLYYGKEYTVYKYLYDNPHGADEEMNLYFIPEFGIMIFRSTAWGGYGRLISNSEQTDFDEIFYLTEKIVGDFNRFYFPLKK